MQSVSTAAPVGQAAGSAVLPQGESPGRKGNCSLSGRFWVSIKEDGRVLRPRAWCDSQFYLYKSHVDSKK